MADGSSRSGAQGSASSEGGNGESPDAPGGYVGPSTAVGYATPSPVYQPFWGGYFADGGPVKKPMEAEANKLRSAGRVNDTMLVHVSPREFSEMNAEWGTPTVNPDTGLPEYFLDDLWDFLGDAAPYIAAAAPFVAPGVGSWIGSTVGPTFGLSSAAAQSTLGNALFGAGLGGATGGGKGALYGGLAGGAGGALSAYGVPYIKDALGMSGATAGGGGPLAGGDANMGPGAVGSGDTSAAASAAAAAPTAGTGTTDDGMGFLAPAALALLGMIGSSGAQQGQQQVGSATSNQDPEALALFRQKALARKLRENDRDAISYGEDPTGEFTFFEDVNPDPVYYAQGGPSRAAGPVAGPGGGQDDLIPAYLADGEHVLDADVVSAIGDGSTDEGHRRVEAMKRKIRGQKRGASAGNIPPKVKGLSAYFGKAA